MKNSLINNIYLCIRFPFLYPRNRFNGLHYTNWKLEDKFRDVSKSIFDYSKNNYQKYFDKFGTSAFGYDEDEEFDISKAFLKAGYAIKLASSKLKFQYRFYNFLRYFLQIFHCLPTYTELDSMSEGWRKCFGIQMCKEIKSALKESNFLYKYRITQIKEKFGGLRWYDECSPDEVQRIINKYEYISANTCIYCGKTAKYISEGYILPYCEDCKNIHSSNVYSFKKNEPFYGWRSFHSN